MFIEKRYTNPLQSRRDDMFIGILDHYFTTVYNMGSEKLEVNQQINRLSFLLCPSGMLSLTFNG